jgi:hypothetical protein
MTVMQRVARTALLAAVLSVAVAWFGSNRAPAQDESRKNTRYPHQVLIIRHAEKTGDKADVHLSGQGQERARVLYQLFVASRDRPDPFPTPDFIFAASNSRDSQRPLETVTPLAQRLRLPVNETYESKLPAAPGPADGKDSTANGRGMLALRDALFGESKYFGKTILVSWRHSTIPELAKTLKASKVPAKWEDNVFDRVWQITYDDQGNAGFRDRPQRLLPGDAEK